MKSAKQMAAWDQKISEIQDEIAKHGAVTGDPMSGAQAGVIFVKGRNAQIKRVKRERGRVAGTARFVGGGRAEGGGRFEVTSGSWATVYLRK